MSTTVTLQPATGIDAYLSKADPTANFGAADNLVAGNLRALSVDYANRIVLQFDVSSIPAYANISSAVLTLDAISGNGISNSTFTLHRVTASWTHLGVTWNTRDGSTAWSSQGGDFVASAADTTSVATSTTDMVFSSLASLVADALLNRSGILNVLIKGPENTGTNTYLNVVSSHRTTGEKPKLVVTYTVPTFTVVDNGDGTGATATIGGTSGAANAVLVASWSGTDSTGWLSKGSRTGDGTLTLDLDPGYYWAQLLCDGVPRGLAYFRVSDSEYSIHYVAALAAQAAIRSLALADVDSDNVLVQKVPWDRPANDNYPKIIISTIGTETMRKGAGTNVRDDVGYPLMISIIDKDKQTLEDNHSRNLLWRQRIAQGVRNQTLGSIPEIYDCTLEPRAIVDPGWFQQNKWHSSMVLIPLSRERRGA